MPILPGLSGPPKIEILKATRNILGLLRNLRPVMRPSVPRLQRPWAISRKPTRSNPWSRCSRMMRSQCAIPPRGAGKHRRASPAGIDRRDVDRG